ncbi:MAG: putative toxin-antitoxin system toxin component, PIN family [Candidatus Diapherotrites archaeon]|nr:putative toxin-antitoxin system toxin component, PIN family [Candidatus Diapherotrites archaeon]
MLRLFVDTNTLVSGLVYFGPEHQLLKKGVLRKVGLVTSEDVMEELVEVISRKFPGKSALVKEFLSVIEITIIGKTEYYTRIGEMVVRDPKDRHVLAAAWAAQCKVIVTGDRDLLSLTSYRNIRIITTTQALRESA